MFTIIVKYQYKNTNIIYIYIYFLAILYKLFYKNGIIKKLINSHNILLLIILKLRNI